MKFKIIYGSLLILVIVCIAFGYLWVDRSISLAHARESERATGEMAVRLKGLLEREWLGMERSVVLGKLRFEINQNPNANIILNEEGNIVWFDGISFRFVDGRLKGIGAE